MIPEKKFLKDICKTVGHDPTTESGEYCIRCEPFFVRIQKGMDVFVGEKITKETLSQMKFKTETVLQDAVDYGEIIAWRNVTSKFTEYPQLVVEAEIFKDGQWVLMSLTT